MKKQILMLCSLPLFMSSYVHADFFSVAFHVDSWQTKANGAFGQTGGEYTFDYKEKNQISYGVSIEHPFPFIPNARLRYQSLEQKASAELNQTFALAGQQFPVGSLIDATLDLSHWDLVLYYELLDNSLIELDIGAQFKRLDGSAAAAQLASSTASDRVVDETLPMLYVAASVNLIGTGFNLFAELSGVTPGRHDVTVYRGGVNYTVVDHLALTSSIQVGYQSMRFQLDNMNGVSTDTESKGIFAGVELKF